MKLEAKAQAEKAMQAKEQPKPPVAQEEVWTNDQQKQLEAGMREFGADIPTKERWTKIAEVVEGKTPK